MHSYGMFFCSVQITGREHGSGALRKLARRLLPGYLRTMFGLKLKLFAPRTRSPYRCPRRPARTMLSAHRLDRPTRTYWRNGRSILKGSMKSTHSGMPSCPIGRVGRRCTAASDKCFTTSSIMMRTFSPSSEVCTERNRIQPASANTMALPLQQQASDLLDKGVFGSKEVSEMPYRSVEGITHSTGMFYGGVQITGLGTSGWRIEDVNPKDSAKSFADSVRSQVEALRAEGPQPSSTPIMSAADELAKWAKLFQDGILTQAEFDAKKQQLLGL